VPVSEPPKAGVLLVNLGTPDAPTARAVRRYLAEFLSDPRVVEIPAIVWKPILYGLVLPVRPARSARKYAMIWSKDGSPLLVHSVKQQSLLTGYLGERVKAMGLPSETAVVELGMRYGHPGIVAALTRLVRLHCERILVVPLYPQYAASTTASVFDAVYAYAGKMRRMPALRTIDAFHDDAGYIRAIARSLNDHWVRNGWPDKLVLSFHGLPKRSIDRGDPYLEQCRETARLVAAELDLQPEQYVVSFQSRFGAAEWLKPYTAETLAALARQGVRRVDVACPGFVSDCLETLEEIGIEGKQTFLSAGGKEFHAIPCLNEHPQWMHALTDLVFRHLQGWL